MTLQPAQLVARLEQIEEDAAKRQAKGEQAAENFHRAKRDYELEYAKQFVQAKGTVTERKQTALNALERHPVYFKLLESEGAYEGWKAAMRTLELRTSIGQSLLKAQRERGA